MYCIIFFDRWLVLDGSEGNNLFFIDVFGWGDFLKDFFGFIIEKLFLEKLEVCCVE